MNGVEIQPFTLLIVSKAKSNSIQNNETVILFHDSTSQAEGEPKPLILEKRVDKTLESNFTTTSIPNSISDDATDSLVPSIQCEPENMVILSSLIDQEEVETGIVSNAGKFFLELFQKNRIE